MIELLLTSLLIALFCIGWDIVLTYDPNEPKRNQMALYWLRKPFIDRQNKIESLYEKERQSIETDYALLIEEAIQSNNKHLIEDIRRDKEHEIKLITDEKNRKLDWYFYLKPILLCKYCFPSIYGTLIFIGLRGFHVELWLQWLLSIICSVILVGIISCVHEKLIR